MVHYNELAAVSLCLLRALVFVLSVVVGLQILMSFAPDAIARHDACTAQATPGLAPPCDDLVFFEPD